eukprot:TRINITY_DN13884_c0_g1_i1.p1 TRINITY_DN13884_c0_g1~~TRINITY_DN13884_c0_g1_i1.p1  ORF type:complete len:282 (+),score=75.13 TRINITY_DN13884_c0_g1_i1:214-1059(+)
MIFSQGKDSNDDVVNIFGKQSQSGDITSYKLLSFLGRGAFGNVFEAQEKATGRAVAIKKIDKDWIRATHNARRIRNEAEIHITLKHPSILGLYRYFEDQNYVYLVLEQCKQGEVFHLLKKKRRFTESEAKRFFKQLVEGVQYLHSQRIVHRDLKLANLLLTDDHNLKISDFGLAARLDDDREERDTLCGTPNYISPEIVEGKPHGLSTDIWSLGVVLYNFLTGGSPFQGNEKENKNDVNNANNGVNNGHHANHHGASKGGSLSNLFARVKKGKLSSARLRL